MMLYVRALSVFFVCFGVTSISRTLHRLDFQEFEIVIKIYTGLQLVLMVQTCSDEIHIYIYRDRIK